MKTEAQKRSDRKYREAHSQICITVSNEIKEIMDKAAEASGKSKAQYIVDLIKKDNNIT